MTPPAAPVAGAGPTNSLADVRGLRAGHATLDDAGWLTGVTVVVTPGEGATGGVDVRGGAPGTRETDLLSPVNQVEKVHAIMLGGGSAFGLSAAHGVMTALAALHRGFPVGPDPSHVVPIVPAAILFDLGRGGVFGNYPGPQAGTAAVEAALSARQDAPVPAGNVGAGTGALAGQLKGGIGSASEVLAGVPAGTSAAAGGGAGGPGGGRGGAGRGDGGPGGDVTVAALVAVNAVGSVTDPRTGVLHGAQFGLPGEFDWLSPPAPDELAAGAGRLDARGRPAPPRPLNTTIGVIATDASLTKAQCAKLAGAAQDGLARAIRPAHSMFDGDAIFGLATGDGPPASPPDFHAILTAAADCFTRAIVHGVLAAATVTTAEGRWPCYLDLFPSAGRR